MNYATEWLENMGDGSVFWTEMLLRGCRLWNGGSDDNHNGHCPVSYTHLAVYKRQDKNRAVAEFHLLDQEVQYTHAFCPLDVYKRQVYPFVQKYFTKGVMIGGVKE